MSRRTTWFTRFTRQRSTERRQPTQRSGRTLGFEQCEPRIALSANAAGGGLSPTTGAVVSEGGLIEFGAYPIAQFSSDFNAPMNLGSVRATLEGSELVLTGAGMFAADADVDRVINVGGLYFHATNVKVIAAPAAGVQHPEGGQIVIIDRPGAEMAALASTEREVAQSRVSQQLVRPSAAETGNGSAAVPEVDGLRGRAIVFEVAHAKPTDRSRGDHAIEDFGSRLAAEEAGDAFAPVQVARRQGSKAITDSERGERVSSTQVASVSKAGDKHDENLAHASSRPAIQVPAVGQAEPSLSDSEAIVVADGDRAPLEVRDMALEQWPHEDAAPLTDSESSPGAALVRSRKVLALAVVLAAGAGPVSKLFRRRAPQATPRQHARHA